MSNNKMNPADNIKHRRSIRLKSYDYGCPNGYFVTLCTYQKRYLFGEIKASQMILNKSGSIVEEEWIKTGQLRAYLDIEPYIIMPNHFHAIVVIHEEDPCRMDTARHVPTDIVRKFGESAGDTLSSIIGSFKAAVTRRLGEDHDLDLHSIWQKRFYDHIIRNEREFELISQYIEQNPELWDKDENNPDAKETIKGIKGLESIFNTKNNSNSINK